MYKLVITRREASVRKIYYLQYWMTQEGIYAAEEKFQALQQNPDVLRLELWRQDLHGIYVLKRWERDTE